MSGRGTTHLTLGMLAAAIGLVGNQLVARYKRRVGREIKSPPHRRCAPFPAGRRRLRWGACGPDRGGPWLEGRRPIAGFAITVLIILIGVDATKDLASRLMDENDEEVAEAIRAVAEAEPGVAQVSEVRARWLGREVEARVPVRLPATMGFVQAHDVAHRVQEAVRAEVPDVREILVEPSPLGEHPDSTSIASDTAR